MSYSLQFLKIHPSSQQQPLSLSIHSIPLNRESREHFLIIKIASDDRQAFLISMFCFIYRRQMEYFMSMTFALEFKSLSAGADGEEEDRELRFDLLFGLSVSRRAVLAFLAS